MICNDSMERKIRHFLRCCLSLAVAAGISGCGDGSVRFLKDSVNPLTLRGLVSLAGGEVISADQY
jgi:hypothetical protein